MQQLQCGTANPGRYGSGVISAIPSRGICGREDWRSCLRFSIATSHSAGVTSGQSSAVSVQFD